MIQLKEGQTVLDETGTEYIIEKGDILKEGVDNTYHYWEVEVSIPSLREFIADAGDLGLSFSEDDYDDYLGSLDGLFNYYMHDGYALGGDMTIWEAKNSYYFNVSCDADRTDLISRFNNSWSSKHWSKLFSIIKKDSKFYSKAKKIINNEWLYKFGNGKNMMSIIDVNCKVLEEGEE